MEKRKVNRRDFLRVSTLTTAGLALAACAAPATPSPAAPQATAVPQPSATPNVSAQATNLVIWTFGSFFTDFYNKILPNYKQLAPNVTIKVEESAQEFDNLQAALASGTGAPDIADIEQGAMSRFFKGEIGLVDLTDFMSPHTSDYIMSRTDPYAFNGKIYGIDQCLCPVVFLYRWDLFEQAGIKMPIATWEDFKTVAMKLKDTGATALSLADRGWGDYHMLLVQRGTGGFFDDKGQPNFNSPDHIDTLNWYVDMIKSGAAAVTPTGDAAYAAMGQGKIAGQIGADWYAGFLKNNIKDVGKGKWKAAPMPAWKAGGSRTSANGGTGYCITKQTKAPTEAWKFIEWATFNTDNKIIEYQVNGLLTPVISQLKDPRWHTPDEWFSGQDLGQLYLDLANEQPRQNRSPYFSEATTLIGDAVFSAVSEGKPVKDVLENAMTQLKKQMQG